MMGDLHCHTRFSDGSLGIDDLVLYAKRSGLDFVAVTDHDTMAGLSRADQLGKRHGIVVMGGVEISARDFSRERPAHLLCYLPKNPNRLEGLIRHTLESRDKAVRESMRKVMTLFPVTEEHITRSAKGAPSLYYAHIMCALCELGYTGEIFGDLFKKLLGPGGSCFVQHDHPDVWDAAEQVHSAGGICVLAHPSSYDSIDLMRELAAKGVIDGIERYHPGVKECDIPAIDETIEKYGLIATGGTDFHGAFTAHPNPLGTCVTTKESIERIFKLSKSR